MARIARVVDPGVPHHITQGGNRRRQTLFSAGDYAACLALLREWCANDGLDAWTYCLLPNHVHLLVVPSTTMGLVHGIGVVHRRYSRMANSREG